MKICEDAVDEAKRELQSMDTEDAVKKQLQTMALARFKLLGDLADKAKKMLDVAEAQDSLKLHTLCLQVQLAVKTEEEEAINGELRQLETKVKELDELLATLKDRTRALHQKALKACTEEELNSPDMQALPDSVEEVTRELEDSEIRAQAHHGCNPQVIDQYNQQVQQIEKLKEELAQKEQRRQTLSNEINDLHQRWETRLKGIVEKINQKFSELFRANKCSGEVVLMPDVNDFRKYAIDIRVRFRDNQPMQSLSPTHQSGGERSVSTMLYLIALHESSACGFRLVDEINQGMDPINERLVYDHTSKVATMDNTPQFFLITPKLLPNLKFNDKTTILSIMNGPWMVSQNDWTGVRNHLMGPGAATTAPAVTPLLPPRQRSIGGVPME
jgi:chromosome segregation ATPase